MATSGPKAGKECGGCHEEFDEEANCPRILECYHSICTACVDGALKNNTKCCPLCQKHFEASDASEIPVNQTAIQLMKYFASLESKPNSSEREVTSDTKSHSDEKIKDSKPENDENNPLRIAKEYCDALLTRLQETKIQIENIRKETEYLSITTSKSNSRIEKDLIPRLQEIVSQNKKRADLLTRIDRKLNTCLKETQTKTKQLESTRVSIDTYKDHSYKDIAEVAMDAQKVIANVSHWFEDLAKLLPDKEEVMQTAEKEIIEAKGKVDIIVQILNPQEDNDEDSDLTVCSFDHISPEEICTELPTTKRSRVRHLVDRGRVISIKSFGRRRSDKTFISDYQRLCSQCSQDSLPVDINIDHHDLKDESDQHIEGFLVV